MTDYGDTPFPGDYQPGQVEASSGFMGAFESSLPHGFSPTASEHSAVVGGGGPGSAGPGSVNGCPSAGIAHSRPATAGALPTGTSQQPSMHDVPMTHSMSCGPGHIHSGAYGSSSSHQHQHSGSSHSHSFSTASLPSLASSSTSFSIPSQGEPAHATPGTMYVGAFGGDFTTSPLLHHDTKALGMDMGPNAGILPPGFMTGGLGMPPTPMSGTLPPAFLGRSPMAGSTPMFPPGALGIGKMSTERSRSASRPSPYQVSSRSNSLSMKSEADEELISIYSNASTGSGGGYGTSWSNTTNLIAGDMGQMTLEHRRSSSTPFDVPSLISHPLPGRTRARSFSLGKAGSTGSLDFLETELEIPGPANEREQAVRSDLASKAEAVRALSPCQHGKARAVWAKRWLKLSYTPVSGFTVPRQGLYHSYTMSCNDFGLRPINSASFGKVVRSTFQGIRTRRLGVRGNSKYHYVSLRPAISTEASRLNAYGDSSGQLHIAPQDAGFGDDQGDQQEILTEDDTDEEEDDDLGDLSEHMPFGSGSFSRARKMSGGSIGHKTNDSLLRAGLPAGFLEHGASTPTLSGASSGTAMGRMNSPPGTGRALPPFPLLPPGVDQNVQQFWTRFCAQQDLISRCIQDMQFDRFDQNYRSFWEASTPETIQMCGQEPLASMIVDATALTFDHIVLSLLDKILLPIIPQVHAQLALLAGNFEKMTAEAHSGLAKEVSVPVTQLSKHVSHLVARFLDLHQVTAAVGPILADPDQLMAMRNSWNFLDITFVAQQSVMACECDDAIVAPALAEFGQWLNEIGADPMAHPVEQLAACVEKSIARAEAALPAMASLLSLIPRGGYITSQVMRLLTLRSDLSFGWFQLVRTWIDDYVTIMCVRRQAFTRRQMAKEHQHQLQQHHQHQHHQHHQRAGSVSVSGSGGATPASAVSVAPPAVFTSLPLEVSTSNGPNLAIDTVSAGYASVLPLEHNAITPRPAFSSNGAVGLTGLGPAALSVAPCAIAGAPSGAFGV